MPGDTVMKLAYENNARIAKETAGCADPLGELSPGAWADVVLLDYRPYTPLTADNLPWQIILGVDGVHVNTTIVGGNIQKLILARALSDRIAMMYEGRITGVVERDQATVEQIGLMMAGISMGEAMQRST
jgi:hypothetical protein